VGHRRIDDDDDDDATALLLLLLLLPLLKPLLQTTTLLMRQRQHPKMFPSPLLEMLANTWHRPIRAYKREHRHDSVDQYT
jgi:hypothetical protein